MPFLDDLARTLAEPMPRRRAVRLIGTSLAAIAVPGVAPRIARATPVSSADVGPDVCPGTQICSTYIDPNAWSKGQKHKCCPFPAQQWTCGSDGWTCVDTCAAAGKALGKKTKPTWSAERLGGNDPAFRDRPKRYDCCPLPDTIPSDGECLPNCGLPRYGRGSRKCGKTCCPSYQLCDEKGEGRCLPCPRDSCQPLGGEGLPICCKPGTNCCANKTSVECCGKDQVCRATKPTKQGLCSCEKGTKCGSDCCEKGERCCKGDDGKECCPPERCLPGGCCPEGRAICQPNSKGYNAMCCGDGEYCFWKMEVDAAGDLLAPLGGTCKRGCAPGNTAGTQCCGTGYRPDKKKRVCVPTG